MRLSARANDSHRFNRRLNLNDHARLGANVRAVAVTGSPGRSCDHTVDGTTGCGPDLRWVALLSMHYTQLNSQK